MTNEKKIKLRTKEDKNLKYAYAVIQFQKKTIDKQKAEIAELKKQLEDKVKET